MVRVLEIQAGSAEIYTGYRAHHGSLQIIVYLSVKTMEIQITIFGQLTDITGSNSISMPAVSDTDELFTALKQRFPALEKAKFVTAVDKKIIHGTTALTANSSIALLPPFSGG